MLLLTGAFIPDSIQAVISQPSFGMNPFESISFFRAKSYGSWTENMKFELNNPTLALFNLKSKSTLYNTISIFITLAYIAFLHVIIYITTWISFISKIEGRWWRWLNRIIIKIFEFLTFSYYIRLAIQLNGFILISSINEVFYMNTSQKLQLLSFIFAVLMIIWSVFLIFILIFLSLSSYQVIENRHNKLGEFFWGLKPMKKNRIYTSISMLRRLLFVTFLITLTSLHSQILIGALTAIEVVYIIYVVFVRPFYETKDNVIEIVNEFIYILLLGSLIVYNTEKDWTSTVAHIYMQVVFSNNLIDWGIIQSKLS